MELDRRGFVKLAAMAAATAAAQGGAPRRAEAAPLPAAGVEWNKAPCRFCGTGCHVQVGVKQGKVVAIAGDTVDDRSIRPSSAVTFSSPGTASRYAPCSSGSCQTMLSGAPEIDRAASMAAVITALTGPDTGS